MPPTYHKERLIDIISVITIGVFTFSAIFLTQDPTQINVHSVNATAVRTVTSWTIICALITMIYRIFT
ncbi:MAG: hypothetical protein ACP5JW_02135 [Candidatus Bathyarchaeia archaeon]